MTEKNSIHAEVPVASDLLLKNREDSLFQLVDRAKTISDEVRQSEEWQNYQLRQTSCVEAPPVVHKKCKEVVFINSMTLDIFKSIWPEIREMVMKAKTAAFDWNCLHHVLTYYKKIEQVSFAVFMTWLNDFCGETLISAVNIRQQRDTYFVVNVAKDWTCQAHKQFFEDRHLSFSLQEQTKYSRYYLLCENLWNLIRIYC